jgi:sucrose-6F-phosphate phosphohydrolase
MPIRLLLCTDLDRTLLPNGPQAESAGARDRFRQLVTQPGVTLVYVTGRDRKLVEDAIDEYRLPQPDYVIADVGSTIYEIHQHDWRYWDQWQREISPDWAGKSHDEMHALFSRSLLLKLQEDSKQNTFKLSYYVPPEADHEALMSEMHSILVNNQIRANLIWSIDELTDTGLLDVLPASANKRHAIEFLMQQLGFDLSNTVFAGDSGNDLAVLTSPIRSVLVANASADVRDDAKQMALNLGQADALYFAHGSFLGMNGNYSAGILEGVAHYLPETTDLIRGDSK